MELNEQIKLLVEHFLKPYFKTLDSYSIYLENENVVLVQVKKKKEDSGFLTMLRLIINEGHGEFLISNIFVPFEDQRKGIGFGVIEFIFEIAKKINFRLALVDMTESFRTKMLKRGAIETSRYDCLEIIETTNLK